MREETKKGKRERVLKGLYNGSLNWGYRRVPREQGGVPIFDPKNIEGYRMAVRLCAEGSSVREIIHAVNLAGYRTTGNWGPRPFPEDTMLPILRNRFYLGEVFYKGEWLPGKHEAAMDHETWERAQEQLRRRAAKHETTKHSDRIYPLRKLVRCITCGHLFRGHFIKGERRYRDPAKDYDEVCPEQQSVSADIFEEPLSTFLSAMKLPEDWQAKILGRLGENIVTTDQTQQTRSRLQLQLERAKRLFMLGDMTEREYLAERTRLQNELAALRPSKVADLEHAAELLNRFGELWQRATDLERLKLFHAIIETVYVKSERIIALEPRPAMFPLLELAARELAEKEHGSAIRILPPGSPPPKAGDQPDNSQS